MEMKMASACSSDLQTFVYVSNAEDGTISTYRMFSSGKLEPRETVKAADFLMPMAVSADRKFLYAAVRSKPYSVFTYAIDANTGELSQVAKAQLAESVPYISLDQANHFMFSASYGGHLIAVNAVEPDGRIGKILQIIPTSRHPHSIRIDNSNKYLFAPSLGADQIMQFIFDEKSGRITANTPFAVQLDEVAGPRHIAISADNKFVYVLSEFLAKVYVFSLDSDTGLLTQVGEANGLPEDSKLTPGKARTPKSLGKPAKATNEISAADIHLTPDGGLLYISERTASTLSSFQVNKKNGQLKFLGVTPTVTQPRGFAIDPRGQYLIASGERSSQIAVYMIETDGELKEIGHYPCGKGANWVEIVTFN